MRFFDEILFGEMKTTLPKWAGIEGINTILDDLSGVISSMGPSTYQALDNGLDEIEEEQEACGAARYQPEEAREDFR